METAEQIADARAKRGEGQTAEERFNSSVAIVIALMAMLLAITSLGGGNAAEDVANNNIHASDTWAFYQAKSIRQTTMRVAADELEAQLRANPNMPPEAREFIQSKVDEYRRTADRYESEPDKDDPDNPLKGEGRKQLTARAQDYEAKREAAQLQDPNFDFAEALFQIAIVLASVSILAGSRNLLLVAVAVGAAATLLMLNGYFLFLPRLFG
ncbi:MAG TPA: DUF4337 domain-containing protein [Pyrinomonadaceae bacterium]|jgi:hypothetical protein|nr:DUF4337 domain-containing protein [Pyrinomonadaceae bacterium]